MPREKLRTPELRDHVLQVALDMLGRQGVARFTTRKVAQEAETSTPAVYELFGDKAGLVRAVFFEGFRRLRRHFDRLEPSDDPNADLAELVVMFRGFVQENPELTQVMFSRPFADFDPGPTEVEAGRAVREFIIDQVRRGVDAGVLDGDPTDIAHALLALALGLASAEMASRLGTTAASVDRRWGLAVNALLRGFHPDPAEP